MDIRQLRYFVTVVEEETVTAAARKLNMTQPPLTTQLQLLEKELNCRLFGREGRRLKVTEAGRHFYQRASVILGLCDAAVAEMRDFDRGTAGTLRIGEVSSVQEGVFTEWITAFAREYPQVRYEVYSANTYQLVEQVRTGQLDLAVVRTPFSAPDIRQMVLGEEALMAAGWEEMFPPEEGETLALEALAGRPLVVYRRWEQIIKARFEARGISPVVRCCTDTAQATLSLAGGGMGIGIIPASAVSGETRKRLKVRGLEDPGLISRIVMICKAEGALSGPAQIFWNFMEKNVTGKPEG